MKDHTRAGAVRSSPRAKWDPAHARKAPKEAGTLEANIGLIIVVAERAMLLLKHDRVRPRSVDEMIGIAAIVVEGLRRRHDPERGRFATFACQYGPSHTAREWRQREGGLRALDKGGYGSKTVRVGMGVGSGHEWFNQRSDGARTPLQAAIENEEAELRRCRVKALRRYEPGLNDLAMRVQGMLIREVAKACGLSHQRIDQRIRRAVERTQRRGAA